MDKIFLSGTFEGVEFEWYEVENVSHDASKIGIDKDDLRDFVFKKFPVFKLNKDFDVVVCFYTPDVFEVLDSGFLGYKAAASFLLDCPDFYCESWVNLDKNIALELFNAKREKMGFDGSATNVGSMIK